MALDIVLFTRYYDTDQMNDDEMNSSCRMHDEQCVQNFSHKNGMDDTCLCT
jgi:hypothetical protein